MRLSPFIYLFFALLVLTVPVVIGDYMKSLMSPGDYIKLKISPREKVYRVGLTARNKALPFFHCYMSWFCQSYMYRTERLDKISVVPTIKKHFKSTCVSCGKSTAHLLTSAGWVEVPLDEVHKYD